MVSDPWSGAGLHLTWEDAIIDETCLTLAMIMPKFSLYDLSEIWLFSDTLQCKIIRLTMQPGWILPVVKILQAVISHQDAKSRNCPSLKTAASCRVPKCTVQYIQLKNVGLVTHTSKKIDSINSVLIPSVLHLFCIRSCHMVVWVNPHAPVLAPDDGLWDIIHV